MKESLEIVERLRKSWRDTWHFTHRGWNFFEAVAYDAAGHSYFISAGVMGNRFVYISTAWVATSNKWHFLNKNFFTQVHHSAAGWRTADGQMESFFDAECGYEVSCVSGQDELDLRFIPNPDYYFWDEARFEHTNFDLLLYNHCLVKGYITLNGEKKQVKGVGSVEHFYGRFAEKIHWQYFSLKSADISLYFRTGRTDKDFFSQTAIVYMPPKVYEFLDLTTEWQVLSERKIRVTARQPGVEFQAILELCLSNPENDKQPYINFHLPPFKEIYANVYEHCALINGSFTIDGQTHSFSGEGVCHLTEAVW